MLVGGLGIRQPCHMRGEGELVCKIGMRSRSGIFQCILYREITYNGKSLIKGNPLQGEIPYKGKSLIRGNPIYGETPYKEPGRRQELQPGAAPEIPAPGQQGMHVSMYLSIYLSIYPSISLSIYLSASRGNRFQLDYTLN